MIGAPELKRVFFGICCGLVGAGFAEATFGGIVRASETQDASSFIPSVAFGLSALAGLLLLRALIGNRAVAVVYAWLSLIAAVIGMYLLQPIKGEFSVSYLSVTFGVIAVFVLTIGVLIGRYPLGEAVETGM